jgi:diguanylate cyclase (GGDEF)-like protein
MRRISRACLFCVMVLLFAVPACAQPPDGVLGAQQGLLDLRGRDWANARPLVLRGEWHLYWNVLSDGSETAGARTPEIAVLPSSWTRQGHARHGTATYILKVLLDPAVPPLAVRVVPPDSACRLLANGSVIAQVGRVGLGRADYMPRRLAVTARIDKPTTELTLALQVSDYDSREGGAAAGILLGSEAAVSRAAVSETNSHYFLMGLIFAMALYHIGLYASRRKETACLYFGLFAVFFVIRMTIADIHDISGVLPGVPWHVWLRLEYLSFYWSAGLFIMFLHVLFPQHYRTTVVRGFQAIAAALSLVTIAAPTAAFTLTLRSFQVVFLAVVVYSLWVLVRAAIAGRFGAITILVGFVVFAGSAVSDVLYYNGILASGPLATYGATLFLFSQAAILAMRFSTSFARVERLSHELEGANDSLREKQRQIEEQNVELTRMATADPLTGLPNRLSLFDTLEREISRAERGNRSLAVMFIDLDEFKTINDTLGHQAGDELLQKVARRLSRIVRRHDELFRLGGDEFTVVLVDVRDAREAGEAAARIAKALEQPVDVAGREMMVRASLGISVFPADGPDVSALMRHADIAMYSVKRSGKGDFAFFDASMIQERQERIALSGRMPRALAQERFVLHYQPQVDAQTRQVTGVEALVRWQEPGEGTIPPGRFIPVAEETGFIITLGEWILREACRQGRIWERAGHNMRVGVNISAVQFALADFPDLVIRILAETGMSAHLLDLEVTEGLIMREEERVVGRLRTLKSAGVTVSIDDFGTGYSSLRYLRMFPLDHLKIDQSFVKGIFGNDYDSEIVRTILDLSRALRLEPIAEGVETEDHRRFLADHGCRLMQGYLFSPPVVADAIKPGEPLNPRVAQPLT